MFIVMPVLLHNRLSTFNTQQAVWLFSWYDTISCKK